jgi:hypothetical protein
MDLVFACPDLGLGGPGRVQFIVKTMIKKIALRFVLGGLVVGVV